MGEDELSKRGPRDMEIYSLLDSLCKCNHPPPDQNWKGLVLEDANKNWQCLNIFRNLVLPAESRKDM